jgi:hypothetical protein
MPINNLEYSKESNLLYQVASCVSTQVLQACTWICAIFRAYSVTTVSMYILQTCRYIVLGYFILLFVSALLVKYNNDATIWSCSVRKIIWQQTRETVTPALPRFRTQEPVIAAPRPRRIITMPEAVLSYRSGLSLDYEIEHYQPPATDLGPSADAPLSPLLLQPSVLPTPVTHTRDFLQPQRPTPAAFAPFYPSYIQTAINPGVSPQVRRLPQAPSPSPPPLGDWPRRDATSLPARGKRKQNLPTPYSFTMPTAVQQHHDQPTRSRPCGPRRRTNSGDHRLPNIPGHT